MNFVRGLLIGFIVVNWIGLALMILLGFNQDSLRIYGAGIIFICPLTGFLNTIAPLWEKSE